MSECSDLSKFDKRSNIGEKTGQIDGDDEDNYDCHVNSIKTFLKSRKNESKLISSIEYIIISYIILVSIFILLYLYMIQKKKIYIITGISNVI